MFKRIIAAVLAIVTLIGLIPMLPAGMTAEAASGYTRLSGSNRCITAAEISKASYNKAANVVIASGDDYADALAGVPLAYALDAPILLIRNHTLDDATLGEIKRLGAKNVYILGGEFAINAKVAKNLTNKGYKVTRLAGSDRFGTSLEIAKKLQSVAGKPSEIIFVYSHNYPDALAVSGVAAAKNCPVLYIAATGKLTNGIASFVKSSGAKKATVISGPAIVGSAAEGNIKKAGVDSVRRIYGANRYETCIKINEAYASVLTGDAICVATGTNYPDALAGGVFAAINKAPLLLVDKSLTKIQRDYVENKEAADVYVFGGTSVVSNKLAGDISAGNEPAAHENFDILKDMLDESIYCWMGAADFDSSKASASRVINDFLICKPVAMGIYTYFEELIKDDPYWVWVTDPLDKYYDCAYRIDADAADWVIENVFEVTPDHKADNGYYYYGDEIYVSGEMGGGPGYDATILETNYLGDNEYGVAVLIHPWADEEGYDTYIYSDIVYFVVSPATDDYYGDYWKILEFSAGSKCYETAEYSKVDQTHAYLNKIAEIQNYYHDRDMWDVDIIYHLCDLNHDGKNDLVTRTGTCEADAVFTFYLYDSNNNSLRKCGTAGGSHTSLCEDVSTGDFYLWNQHMGYVMISKVNISGNDISVKVVSQGPDVDYYEDYENSDILIDEYKDFMYVDSFWPYDTLLPVFEDIINGSKIKLEILYGDGYNPVFW